ncbi:MAG: EboA domain-containing protein [Verrucomicrobiales bacterium]|nr:EboA domain-containing protein [Verrucomicrobiales bacterium]
MTLEEQLLVILRRTASAEAMDWLAQECATQRGNFVQRSFYYAFSGVSRRFDKRGGLQLQVEDEPQLTALVEGLSLQGWDQFRLGRVILLLVLAEQDELIFMETLEKLLGTADLREQAAIYSALPLFPRGEQLVELAQDGLRTNIVDVFDAVALGNAFPAKFFADDAWNQMVLKALFISRPLYQIFGMDERANVHLVEALVDLAHERWAAGRWVSPELWRSCQKFVNELALADLTRLLESKQPGQREVVALLLADEGSNEGVGALREQVADLIERVKAGDLTWDQVGRDFGKDSFSVFDDKQSEPA